MRPIVGDLTPPVDLDRDHWRGGGHAAVTLVEYGDYECTTVAWPSAPSNGWSSSSAASCGSCSATFLSPPSIPMRSRPPMSSRRPRLQGQFWPMHELLFHCQKALEDADLLRYVDQLGLDRQCLAVDLEGPSVRQRVQADIDSALASGAQGTPTLFINGRLHLGGYDEATLGAALAAAITARGGRSKP